MEKIKKYTVLALVIGLFSELYFYPFEGQMKFAAGVIVFNLIILISEDISVLSLSFFSGLSVFFIRNAVGMLTLSYSFQGIITHNIPSFLYYICCGVLIKFTKVTKYKDNIFQTLILLALVDSFSNIFEAVIRNDINLYVIKVIILAGFTRSLIAYIVYLLYNKQKLFILSTEHQKRYTELNLLVSNIQAEMFYLKKSMKDIEKVMGKSYGLYNSYKNNKELKEKTLDIAREVHEIKKDYYRVIKGFEAFITDFENDDSMTISNIFTIINDNTKRYLKEYDKAVKISFSYHKDFQLKSYYNLFTILNNLIVNSIDFCEDNDSIIVTEYEEAEYISFEVKDTGRGIEEDIISYIFNPGFTTKYDMETGKSSTGIGLSHVKNIIEDLNGSIEVKSKVNHETIFTMKIPKRSLQ